MKLNIVLPVLGLVALAYSSISQTYLVQVKPAGSKTWGYANEKGEIVIPATFEKCYEFSEEGYAPIYEPSEKAHHFIDVKGKRLATQITDFKLREGFLFGFGLRGFTEGMTAIMQNKKFGYMNTEGKVVVQPKFNDATEFDGGYAVANSEAKRIIIDKKGNETPVEIPGLLDVNKFSEGFAPYRAADKQWGFVNTSGKIVIQAKFLSVGYFSNGLAWAKTSDNKIGYIDTDGNWVIKPGFDVAKEFDKSTGLARVKTGEKWAYTNKAGEISTMSDSEVISDFSDGLAEGKKNGKIGFYNAKCVWEIEPQFDGVRDFKNGFAAAKKGEKWGMINKQGDWVIQPIYDGIHDMALVK